MFLFDDENKKRSSCEQQSGAPVVFWAIGAALFDCIDVLDVPRRGTFRRIGNTKIAIA